MWIKNVLTQSRIILWAGGSIPDDGSTVSKQVLVLCRILRNICALIRKRMRIKNVSTQGRIILLAGGSLPVDNFIVSKTSCSSLLNLELHMCSDS